MHKSNIIQQYPCPSVNKLNAALHYAKSVCIMGSSNKIEDIQKTNGWVYFLKTRYAKPGYYKKWTTMYSLCLMSNKIQIDKGKIYVKIHNNRLHYTLINASQKIVTGLIEEDEIRDSLKENDINKEKKLPILFKEPLDMNKLNEFHENILNILLKRKHLNTADQLTALDKEINATINSECISSMLAKQSLHKQSLFSHPNKQWYYHVENQNVSSLDETLIKAYCLQEGESPLDKLTGTTLTVLKPLLKHTMLNLERRSDNCQGLAILIAKYLWEHAGTDIKRIEIISFEGMDHCFVMVNRSGQLNYPKTWGKGAYIIDPWVFDGIIFPATEFSKQVKEIIKFVNKQHREINILFNADKQIYDTKMTPSLHCEANILPGSNRYPTNFPQQVEDYYGLVNTYYTYPFLGRSEKNIDDHINELLKMDKKNHQKKFQACLYEITTLPQEPIRKENMSISTPGNKKQ